MASQKKYRERKIKRKGVPQIFDKLFTIRKQILILPHLNVDRKILFKGKSGKTPNISLPTAWVQQEGLSNATAYLAQVENSPCVILFLHNSTHSDESLGNELEKKKQKFIISMKKGEEKNAKK